MLAVALNCLLIVVARIVDVALGTIRTINVVQGRRMVALVLGFVEILVWIFVVSQVINEIRQPAYAIAYALGFALGNYVGMVIESRLALGRQVVRIITREGAELAAALRANELRVTQFDGFGRDGPVQEVFIQVDRYHAPEVVTKARTLDPQCFYMIDDIRTASSPESRGAADFWRTLIKKK